MVDTSMMNEKLRIFENLFNEKLRVLETAYNNLQIDNNNLKTENIKDKTEINNLKNRIDILETCVNIPLSSVRGSNESRYTLTHDSVLFNTGRGYCSVFLNSIIKNVFFFFFFFIFL
jgi:hypothetical protein